MLMSNGKEMWIAGVDFRGDVPEVCYQLGNMHEPRVLALDFEGCGSRTACYRKVLSALKKTGDKDSVRVAVVLPDMERDTIEQNLRDAVNAGFAEGQVQVLSEMEALVHFVMSQPADIWSKQVFLLEFQDEAIRAVSLKVNRRTMPMLVETSEPDFWYVGGYADANRDTVIAQTVRSKFGKEMVSSVFITGTDLNDRQYKRSREEICFRRRVFLAEQMYARGACVMAGDTKEKKSYIYMSEQTLLYNVGIRASKGRKEQLHTLITAGCNWYDAQGYAEMMLLGEPVLEFAFQSMLGGNPILAGMRLTDLPKRPDGTTRLKVEIHFSDEKECEVVVTDLGFGELFPAADLYWKESFSLREQEV